jgi:hypothetical protein
MKRAQSLTKTLQRLDRNALRLRGQVALAIEAAGESDAFFEDINGQDLNPGWRGLGSANQQTKAI